MKVKFEQDLAELMLLHPALDLTSDLTSDSTPDSLESPLVNILQKSVTYARNRVSSANFLPTQFWGKISRKTLNLGQNFAKDD